MKEKTKKEETYDFQLIKTNLIDTEGQSVREMQDDDHVVELAMTIATHGLLQPIVVRRTDNGRYQLLAGFHRLAAFGRLKRDNIPANIIHNKQTPIKALALIENIIRRDVSIIEEVNAVCYLNQEEKLSPSSICDLLGKGRDWVNRRLSIPNLPEDVRNELMDGRISISHAEIISRLEDKSARALVLNQTIQARLSARQTNELTDMYLEAPSISEAINAGLETAQNIQAESKIYRKCEACKGIHRLEDIRFVCMCPECWNIVETIQLNALDEKRRADGDRK